MKETRCRSVLLAAFILISPAAGASERVAREFEQLKKGVEDVGARLDSIERQLAIFRNVTVAKFKGADTNSRYSLRLDLTIQNKNDMPVKDLTVSCGQYGSSGTEIRRDQQVIFQVFPAGKTRTVLDLYFGFPHEQMEKVSCRVDDVRY